MARQLTPPPRDNAAGTLQDWSYETYADIVPTPAAGRNRDFIVALESVRGLAALTVLFFHSALVLQPPSFTEYKKLSALTSGEELFRRLFFAVFDGHIAVDLFFVLSGFVLTLSLRRDDRSFVRRAGGFVGRRFFRIYPALAVNLLVTAAVVAGLSAAFPIIMPSSFTWGELARNFLLVDFPINGGTWTLLIELLAIPLLLIGNVLACRFGIGGIVPLAAATIVILFSPPLVRKLVPGESLYFLRVYIIEGQFLFVAGILAAELPMRNRLGYRLGNQFGNQLANRPRAVTLALLAAFVTMLSARLLLGYTTRWALLFEGTAAAILVGLLAYGPRLAVHNLLEWRPIRFLGRISYSFYLYHATGLVMLAPAAAWYMTAAGVAAHPILFPLFITVSVASVTIPLAWLSYTIIERPMRRLGSRL